jgi:hypothetical protein
MQGNIGKKEKSAKNFLQNDGTEGAWRWRKVRRAADADAVDIPSPPRDLLACCMPCSINPLSVPSIIDGRRSVLMILGDELCALTCSCRRRKYRGPTSGIGKAPVSALKRRKCQLFAGLRQFCRRRRRCRRRHGNGACVFSAELRLVRLYTVTAGVISMHYSMERVSNANKDDQNMN